MIKIILFLTLYAITIKASAVSVQPDEQWELKVPILLEKYNVPGVAVVILNQGEEVKYRFFGYSDLATKQQIGENTGFNVGSISKTVTAWGVMKLVELGKIELDAPIQQYLTRWKIPKSPYDPSGVTVRRLLNHTSGLSQHAVPQFELTETVPSIEASLANYTNHGGEKVRLVNSPGTNWSYSGGGYTLLQLMIEEVTKEPFSSFMRREILLPLGMFDSSFEPDEKLLKNLAKSHGRDGRQTKRLRFAATGSAGLQTTPHDLALFASAALTFNDKAIAGRGILTPEHVSKMTSISANAKLPDGRVAHRNYGYGYFISDSKPYWFGHGGDNRGWHSRFILFPSTKNGIVILTNSSNGFWLAQDIFCMVTNEIVGEDETNCD